MPRTCKQSTCVYGHGYRDASGSNNKTNEGGPKSKTSTGSDANKATSMWVAGPNPMEEETIDADVLARCLFPHHTRKALATDGVKGISCSLVTRAKLTTLCCPHA